MSSILTNTSSMVALQTLKGINSNLNQIQNQISTGKAIGNAKDNAAIWAVSKVMESDVAGFEAISDSLGLGESTVALAQKASESVTDLLKQMKGHIVAAQEENVDRGKIQKAIEDLTDQIQSIVGAAQFSGLNLIDGVSSEDMSVLASLNRAPDGTVTAAHIGVERVSLSTTTPVTAQNFGTTVFANTAGAETYLDVAGAATLHTAGAYVPANELTVANGTPSAPITIGNVASGISYEIMLSDVDVNVVGGGSALADRTFQYVASGEDGTNSVAQALAQQINAFFGAATNSTHNYTATVQNGNEIVLSHTNGTDDMVVSLRALQDGTPGSNPATGGLGALQNIDVTTDVGATGALTAIETLIQTSIDAAAVFGSAASRIETQKSFVSNMTDSLKTGIGALVDADMEEASARLQALQVQQQLGIQALSIANAAPQSIMSLFR